ncbi:RDD family protein [Cryomorphaceae bacterium 1068]|nr:RDD family protein [Cryomorphaceae bacterium 1068]
MKFDNDYNLLTKPNLGKRFVAGLIDYGLIVLYFILMIYLFGEPNDDGGHSVNGWPAFSILVVWFLLTVGLEQFTGSTLGNKSQRLIVKPKMGLHKNLTFGQSFKRHLLDMIDLWPFGLIGILTIKNTEHNQRLGDLWAKTIVLDVTDPEQGRTQKEKKN